MNHALRFVVWLCVLGCAASPQWREVAVERASRLPYVPAEFEVSIDLRRTFVANWSDPDAPGSGSAAWLGEDVLVAVYEGLIRFDLDGHVVASRPFPGGAFRVLGVGERALVFHDNGASLLDGALRTEEEVSLEGFEVRDARLERGRVRLLGRFEDPGPRVRGVPVALVTVDEEPGQVWLDCDDRLNACRGVAFRGGAPAAGVTWLWNVQTSTHDTVVSRVRLDGHSDSVRVRAWPPQFDLRGGRVTWVAGGVVTELDADLSSMRELDFGGRRVTRLGDRWLVERGRHVETWVEEGEAFVRRSRTRARVFAQFGAFWCTSRRCEGPDSTVALPGAPTVAAMGTNGRVHLRTRGGDVWLPEGEPAPDVRGRPVFVRDRVFFVAGAPLEVTRVPPRE